MTARAASGQAKEEVDVAEGEKKDVQLVLVARAVRGHRGGDNNGPAEPEARTTSHSPGVLT